MDTPAWLCSWGECIATHDAVWNFFTFIIKDIKFHVLREQNHVSWLHLSNHHGDKWILCLQQMVFAFW
jgi:hypothetical protein